MEKGKAGEHYIIAGPSHTLVEALDVAQHITGVPAPRHVAPGLLKAMSSVVGVTEKVVPMPEQYSAEYLRVSAGVTYLGTSARAQREWDYHPRPLEEGLTATLHHEMQSLDMIVNA
jgi:hypothetical protein